MPLVGGDVNVGDVVVRVGDTVRRPVGPQTERSHALLRHFEAVGFEGAPRVLGIDERGTRDPLVRRGGAGASRRSRRTTTSSPSSARSCGGCTTPRPASSRRPTRSWHSGPRRHAGGEVICHNDIFRPNVIFRDGRPVALIDWDLAGPAPRLYDVASAANFWVPLRPRRRRRALGLPPTARASGFAPLRRATGSTRPTGELLDVVAHRNRMGYETHRLYGGERRLPGWREMWDAGSGDVILERSAWFEAHRADLQRSLA